MKFSSQEEYGLRCLLQLARHGGTTANLTIPEVSREEGLSPAYVAKLMRLLRLGGFVVSVRGQEGGYSLAVPSQGILVSNVLETLGGRIYDPEFCENHTGTEEECMHFVACSIKPLWHRVQSAIDQSLKGVTLADLLPSEPRVIQMDLSSVAART